MLAVHDLCVDYGRHTVVRNFSARPLQPGTLTALIGPNGSGKSTLLRGLAGLLRPRCGQVRLHDVDLLAIDPARRARLAGYLPQILPAAVRLRVFEAVLVAGAVAEGSRAPAMSAQLGRVEQLLMHLGIEHLAPRYLDELSGGQRQMVAVAQALMRDPVLLLLDEPFAALDLNYQAHLLHLLRRETRERLLVTVVVMHDLAWVLREADHVWLMHEGALFAEGTPAEVITAAHLAAVYGVEAHVDAGQQGWPQVIVRGLSRPLT